MIKLGRKKTALFIAAFLPFVFVVGFFSFIHQDTYDDFLEVKLSLDKKLVLSIQDSSGIEVLDSLDELSAKKIVTSITSISNQTNKYGYDLEAIYNQFSLSFNNEFQHSSTLDTLNALLGFSEELKMAEFIDVRNELIYSAIRSSILNKVANDLSELVKKDKAIKFTFKFKSLFRRCVKENYNPGIKDSSIEKVLYNVINGKFTYLSNRFWLRTSSTFKIFVFGVGLIILFTSFYGSIKLILKFKNQSK